MEFREGNIDAIAALKAALPIMAGYVGIGIPCGILESQVGMSPLQAFLISAVFYSGAGQFMIPSMLMSAASYATIIASVSAINTRQILYSASFAQLTGKVSKLLAFFFTAGVTDESYGVNVSRFLTGKWNVGNALLVNLFCMLSWASANALGALLAEAVSIPLALGSFAMTSIFICLLCGQKFDSTVTVVVIATVAGVIVCKLLFPGPQVLVGACCGVMAGFLKQRFSNDVVD